MNQNMMSTELFLDWYGIWPGATAYDQDKRAWVSEAPQGVKLSVQKAQKSQPLEISDSTWENAAAGYVNVLLEDGRYRMWYGVYGSDRNVLCYAESSDGFSWKRPQLGLYDSFGSGSGNPATNNIVFHKGIEGIVFHDPSANAAERYKLVDMTAGADYQGRRIAGEELQQVEKELRDQGVSPADIFGKHLRLVGQVRGAVSPDGLHWSRIEEPLFEKFCDTQNVVLYDSLLKKYVGYWRASNGRRRCIARSETPDFRHWPQPQIVLQPDGQDPPTDDYYTNGYCRYPAGDYPYVSDYHLMFPAIYRRVRDTTDVQLAVSRDGFNWSWPERRPVLEPGLEGIQDQGGIYPGPGLLPLGKDRWGLICRGEEKFHNEGYYYEPGAQQGPIYWATWQRDRLVALEAPAQGKVTMNKLVCHGERLLLNYQTEANGWIKVEMVEPTLWPPAPLQPLPGYSLADCEPLRGDSMAGEVRWQGSADLSALQGREICLRITMYGAKLFAVTI